MSKSVEKCWRQVLPWLSCTGEPVIEPGPEAEAAVLALVLAVHETACWRCWGRDGPEGAGARDWSRACPERARLEALAGKEEGQ